MTDSGTPIQSQLAQFLVSGARHGRGYVLLHPDHVTTMVSPADIVGYSALAARGRDVRATPDGMTITPWKACGEG